VLCVDLAAQRKPLHPQAPFPYRSLDVSVRTADEDSLRGVLTVPDGAGPFPAIVPIPGGQLPYDADYTFRDAPRAGYKPYLVVAEFFSRRGFVTIRLSERANKASRYRCWRWPAQRRSIAGTCLQSPRRSSLLEIPTTRRLSSRAWTIALDLHEEDE
jgi:hypothetical protein